MTADSTSKSQKKDVHLVEFNVEEIELILYLIGAADVIVLDPTENGAIQSGQMLGEASLRIAEMRLHDTYDILMQKLLTAGLSMNSPLIQKLSLFLGPISFKKSSPPDTLS